MTQLILTEQSGSETIINLGPQHPSAHGVINFRLNMQGEIIKANDPGVGYLHRSIEKIAENIPYPSFMPYTDRIDYLGAMFANHGYAMGVEKLAEVEVPRRAQYIRVIVDELNRIASHIIGLGSMSMDLGAFTPFVLGIKEREIINNFTDEICGARLTYNYMRIGGVSRDLSSDLAKRIRDFAIHFPDFIDEFNRLISFNEIFINRLAHVAVISREDAIGFGLAGPNLRASGVNYDLRRNAPYSVYPEFNFDVIVGKGYKGVIGDCYDRFFCRIEEMAQSCKIIEQAVDGLPEGEYLGKAKKKLKPAKGEVYSRVESARGEMGFYIISDGSEQPLRNKVRTGSFSAMSILEKISPGLMLADFVALFSSLDVIAPEVDR